MRVRGRRRCAACDTRWSYFETGSVSCPDCGGLRSVAVDDERTLHTDAPATLDLGPAQAKLNDRPLREVATTARSAAATYVEARGFVSGGELLDLDDRVLAAAELRLVADHVRRARSVDEAVEAHFLDLLANAAAGGRPDEVPVVLHPARGLAAATTVEAYRRDLGRWLTDRPEPAASSVLDRLRSHERRVVALDGEVRPSVADALVAAARDLGASLRDDDAEALSRAERRLAELG